MRIYTTDVNGPFDFDFVETCLPILTDYRKERVLRFKSDIPKYSSLAAELLLFYALKDNGYDIKNIEYEFGEYGKPFLKTYPKCFFSISHSGGKVMVAIAESMVGCDIEKIKGKNLNIADRFFHPEEIEHINNTDEFHRSFEFFRIWTLKESYIKMTGRGLGVGLNTFSVLDKDLRDTVFFKELVIYMGYKCAFCLEKDPGTIEFKKLRINDIIETVFDSRRNDENWSGL